MGQIYSNLRRLCEIEDTPFEIPRKWERILPDFFRGFRRLDVPIFLGGFIV
jgi:hypothetical protein